MLQNGEKIFVNHWQNGQLGISLQNGDPVTAVTPSPISGNADYLQVGAGAAMDGGDVMFCGVLLAANDYLYKEVCNA